ncbi:putative ubiquitin activating enzyme E1 [Cutaneotrichosporon oleaginosum]|uniref:Ubiquitin-activating enzyme E1-like n=1 Tax=Cutaneotrichosporon oleaginosum TaxID=879819 RepID=A0A0J1BB66_9TREE|nr:putative ubiquitin activating enzyme E1 [Cutaneotrichosporon oleaginosum]KLT45229.1 putative ubiquitin activating enzyme E1 [Cutaneotrichosporon oleaginosum]TXT14938.1 hypothetical protein COLE_01131 [Cutaneotrichosporon oleaginosum]
MGRLSSTEALLGPELFTKVRETPVLVVGSGGIGCELLKNLVLVGFKNIEIIDLDTIDLSNLNRQFLFRKPDISKPKSIVAAATARHFNPSSGIEIHARHGNVKEPENDIEWIKQFGVVMSALDNMDARRHINKLCLAANVPLIESGTAGYLGQANPIIKNETLCYDCVTRPPPKSFPVCTIRSTPSEPIHCIVWGKTYLFGKLFGEDDEALDEEELDKAKADGENADEIDNLRKEAEAFREVRRMLGEEDGPQRVFTKVFFDDINRLLAMEDMWTRPGRVKPVALDYDKIMAGEFVPPPLRQAPPKGPTANGSIASSKPAPPPKAKGATLKDQKELSTKESLELFLDSCRRLSSRAIAHPEVVLAFDKDDEDTLDFVTAVANLRATAYGIPTRTRFQIKEMAGNIIPAIATTNAIVAGLVVMKALAVLKDKATLNQSFLRQSTNWPIKNSGVDQPNPACPVCNDVYIPFKVDLQKLTLGRFVQEVVHQWLRQSIPDDAEYEAIVMEGGRLLADPDFEDNYGRTLADLGVTRGQYLTVADEDSVYCRVHFCIAAPDEGSESAYTLPEAIPVVPLRPAAEKELSEASEDEIIAGSASSPAPTTAKRPAPDDGETPSKKRKMGADQADAIEIE